MNTKTLVLLGSLLLTGAHLEADDPIHVRVTPAVSIAPADIRISVYVERRPQTHMMLRVTADSGEFFRRSEMPIGESSPRLSIFEFRQLPPGTYDVTAELVSYNGKTTDLTRCPVRVM